MKGKGVLLIGNKGVLIMELSNSKYGCKIHIYTWLKVQMSVWGAIGIPEDSHQKKLVFS